MKNTIIGIAISAITLAACNDSSKKSNESVTKNNDTTQVKTEDTKVNSPIREIVIGYLQLKNALVNDDGPEASNSGKKIVDAIERIKNSALTATQKKAVDDVADDIKENAQHCVENGNKIEHQREHFEMLSQDMYDLVKAVGTGQTLYYDHCPMYNNNKGANWISETKEIKNPYLGKKMPDCGSVKEELK